MEATNNEKSNDALRQIFEDAENNLMMQLGMGMRYTYFSNQIAEMLERGYSESDINWDIINKKLYSDVDAYDNNMYSSVHSIKELEDAREQCLEAQLLNLSWRKIVCKDCHKVFTLSYSECNFYEKKGFVLPKRCSCCRDKRKGDKK